MHEFAEAAVFHDIGEIEVAFGADEIIGSNCHTGPGMGEPEPRAPPVETTRLSW